jgi:ADP-heptose:LPS heptosyltransferase
VFRRLIRLLRPNPLDTLLRRAKRAGHGRFLLFWNRGLGDVPLGLYAINYRIRTFIPAARIAYITRSDLADAFAMLDGVQTIVAADWRRYEPVDTAATLRQLGISSADFDVLVESPDPTYWVRWQLGKLVPRLTWPRRWSGAAEPLGVKGRGFVAMHVHSETRYGYEKNAPLSTWQALATGLAPRPVALLGFKRDEAFAGMDHVIDLRGRTTLVQLLDFVLHQCSALIAPDSGILSLLYYVERAAPLSIVSLWSDPRQGILKQNVASPNPLLRHTPLIAPDRDLRRVGPSSILASLAALEAGAKPG